jgi:hypothetical protein
MPEGAFEWWLARAPFDPAEPHLKLINNKGFAVSRNLPPELVWLTLAPGHG